MMAQGADVAAMWRERTCTRPYTIGSDQMAAVCCKTPILYGTLGRLLVVYGCTRERKAATGGGGGKELAI